MSRRRRLSRRVEPSRALLIAGALGVGGCAAAPAPPPVSLVPVTTAPAAFTSSDGVSSVDADAALRAGLMRAHGSRLLPSAALFAEQPATCPEDPACLVATGRRAGARKLAQVRIASLGTTTLVRVVVFDLVRGTQEQTRQELVRDADDRTVSEAIARAAEIVARPWAPAQRSPSETSTPVTRSGWFWGGIGVLVVGGAAAAIGVATTTSDSKPATTPPERPDVTLTPP